MHASNSDHTATITQGNLAIRDLEQHTGLLPGAYLWKCRMVYDQRFNLYHFKFVVEELLDSDDSTFGHLMNGEVRSDVFESLTLEEVKDLKLVFDAFDTDCTG